MSKVEVAVVTGSNKGIGLAIVQALCTKFKGDVYLTARNEERGQKALKSLEKEGIKAKFHQLDIDNEESITALHDHMVSTYGGIDILINNAGIAFNDADPTPFGKQTKLTIDTNFFGTLKASNILIPIVRPGGRVVNVSSMLGSASLQQCSPELQKEFRSNTITEEQLIKRMNEFVDLAGKGTHCKNGWPNSAYSVSKMGVTVMSRIYARLLRQQGKKDILLNACCPGWVRTDLTGPEAHKSPAEGAETPVYLALLPEGATEPNGQLVLDKVIQKW